MLFLAWELLKQPAIADILVFSQLFLEIVASVAKSSTLQSSLQQPCVPTQAGVIRLETMREHIHMPIWVASSVMVIRVGTILKEDSLDLLAAFMGKGDEVAALTNQAMDGTMNLEQVPCLLGCY